MSVTMVPYGGSPGRAPLIMYSQATVRSNTKDQAVLRRDHTLKKGKGKAPWNRTSHSQDHCTRYPLVDKGNSAQSTRPLSYVCTITKARYSGVWHESGAAAPCLRQVSALSLTQRGGNHPVHLPRKTPDNSKARGGDKRGILCPPSALRSIL